MSADSEGFLRPVVDGGACISCGACERICPVLNVSGERGPVDAFGAYNRCEETVYESSSGGVFGALAEYVISIGGTVYGAAFDGAESVAHVRVDTLEALPMIFGSKYLQSELRDTLRQVKSDLNLGKTVLFSGTPCQTAGLHGYLGREYDGLICVDTICHSVPSSKAWRNFVRSSEQNSGSKVVRANFRDKRKSWKDYCLCLTHEDGSETVLASASNLYMKAFINGLSTRESCYNCRFKGQSRLSDITLGDFWGVEDVCPAQCNERGTSIVLVQSEKGAELLRAIISKLNVFDVDAIAALAHNPAYYFSAKPHKKRKLFFDSVECSDFCELTERLLKPSFAMRMLARIRRSLPCRALRYLKRRLIRTK
ncbi:MAG: (4Fe-4S)-binding protein [Ruminococcaceae bacterium]|nr:(4Fe-4S)-binding protein [Oscillospiraceae bacterium]